MQLSGWGAADGIYLIDKCSHKIGAGGKGYTTSAEGHKRLEGYGGGGGGTVQTSAGGGSKLPSAPAYHAPPEWGAQNPIGGAPGV